MNTMHADAVISAAFFLALVAVVKIISDGLLKRRVLSAQLSAGQTREFAAWTRDAAREDALRWALVWIGIGSSLVVIDLLPLTITDPAAYGLIFIAGGAGLLAYRSLAARKDDGRTPTIQEE